LEGEIWLDIGMPLVGRRSERLSLLDALQSPEAELVAVYGRRRVGKTFLIREVYGDARRLADCPPAV